MRPPKETRDLWASLQTNASEDPERFDPSSLLGLPEPAQRWLRRVIPDGTPLISTVTVTMAGTIRVGAWLRFRAEQVLTAGIGFVWSPIIGGRLLRIVGGDYLGPQGAAMTFRLHGLIPLVNENGPEVVRSAQGRLAAETIAWLPQAATPQAGARWTAFDDERAIVTLDAAGRLVDVEVTIDKAGKLAAVRLDRWRAESQADEPFGCEIQAEYVTDAGVRVAGSADVGWGYGTPKWDEGVFFRFALLGLD